MTLFVNADLTDAHAREYRAAAEAVADQTPSPRPVYAEGDFVSGRTAGKSWSGRILCIEGHRLTIEGDGFWIAVDARDVTH